MLSWGLGVNGVKDLSTGRRVYGDGFSGQLKHNDN